MSENSASNAKSLENSVLWRTIGAVVVAAVLVVVWHVVVKQFDVPPAIIPSPAEVLSAAVKEKRTLAIGFAMTAGVAITALMSSIVVGTLLAMLFSLSKILRSTFYPYVIFLQTVPIVAIAPLLVTWFGYGFKTIVLVAMIISLFPIISNVTAGLISVDANLLGVISIESSDSLANYVATSSSIRGAQPYSGC